MADISELFWQADLEDIKRGYTYQPETDEYTCLICGRSFENGRIYPHQGQLYQAKRFVELHITAEHQSVFGYLLQLDKKLTGLTEHQKTLLGLFNAGHSDNEVARELGTAASTVRNHRFSLREKQKQAKLFLALMDLLAEQLPKRQAFIDIPRNSRQVDDRFAITQAERAEILEKYFPEGPDGPLSSFPTREKRKVAILHHLVERFSLGQTYTEKEVNAILRPIYADYVLLRRYLIEYGFLDRTSDGGSYWVRL